MTKETFNIIIKCDSEEDREEVLNIINDGLILKLCMKEKLLDMEKNLMFTFQKMMKDIITTNLEN